MRAGRVRGEARVGDPGALDHAQRLDAGTTVRNADLHHRPRGRFPRWERARRRRVRRRRKRGVATEVARAPKWHHGKRRHVHAAGLENLEVRRALGLNCVRIVAPKNENAAGVITHHGTSARRRTAKNCKRKKKRRPFDAHEFGLVPRAKKLHVPVRVGVVELPDGSRKHVAVAYGAPCRAPLNPCVVKKHNGLEGTLEARRVRRGQSLGNEVGPRPLNVRRVRRRRLQSSSYAVHVDHWVALRGVHATGAAGEV